MLEFYRGTEYERPQTISKPKKPQPIAVKSASNRETIDAYSKLAKQVGYECPAFRKEQFNLFLQEENIPVYDLLQVTDYLRELAKNAKVAHAVAQWIPLRRKDFEKLHKDYKESPIFTAISVAATNGLIYQEIIPLSVLQTIAKIDAAFPDAQLYVSQIVTVPDPFLAVGFPRQTLIIVDFWAEPGFQPKG